MGNDTSKQKNENQQQQQQQQDVVYDGFEDLILQASKVTTSKPVGADERRLLLSLELFSLLDKQHLQDSKEYYEKYNVIPSNNNNSIEKTKVSFSETFKWTMLSMMRSCSVCHQTHCSFHRQSLILPPFRVPRSSSCNLRLKNPLVDIFVDEEVHHEPSMRFICDSCLEMVHIPRYEALKQEVAIVANRTRGFSMGTMYFDIVDGSSVMGRQSPVFSNQQQQNGDTTNIVRHVIGKEIVLDDFEPTVGLSQIQNSLLLKNDDDDQKEKEKMEYDQICVTGLQVAGTSLTEDTVFKILKNPDLKRLSLSFGQASNLSWSALSNFVEWYLEKNNNKLSALDSIEELKIGGSNIGGSKSDDSVLPLHRFVKLKSLTLSCVPVNETDLVKMICTMSREDEQRQQKEFLSSGKKILGGKRIPPAGCRFLQNVILVNLPNLTLDFVLDTFGQLPLNLLSCASMPVAANALAASQSVIQNRILVDRSNQKNNNNKTQNSNNNGPQEGQIFYHDDEEETNNNNINDDDNQQNDNSNKATEIRKSPINVSTLVMWGSNATVAWMSQNLLPRALFLVSIDVSSLSILVTQFLDACAAANLSLLRVVKANNCNYAESSVKINSGAIPTTGSDAFNETGFFFYLEGVRRRVTTWENLVSLSTLQLQKFRVLSNHFVANSTNNKRNSIQNQQKNVAPNDIDELSKLSTLPSLTSITISFLNDVAESAFVHPLVLGQLSVLTSLHFHGDGKSPTLPRGLTQSELTISGAANAADGETSEKLILPNLQKLHLYNHPPFAFAFSGAPNLRQILIGGCQHKERLRDFLERGAGRNVEELTFCKDSIAFGLNPIDLPFGSCSKLKTLNLEYSRFVTPASLDALSSCKTTMKKLVLTDVGQYSGGLSEGDLESALHGMNLLEELDLSDTEAGITFTGILPLKSSTTTSHTSSSSRFVILPCLKKFFKREMVADGYGYTSRKHRELGAGNGVLRWLSQQPVLEEIDLEGSAITVAEFPDFWRSPAMENSVKYLNIAHVFYSTTNGTEVESCMNETVSHYPRALRVLVWNHAWHGKGVQRGLEMIPNLKALQIFNLFSPLKESKDLIWSEAWTKKMNAKGIQITSGQGYSCLVTRK